MKKVMIGILVEIFIVAIIFLVAMKLIKPKEVTITETGYTEDGRIDMATVEGYRIFRKECKDIGIILPRRPQYE